MGRRVRRVIYRDGEEFGEIELEPDPSGRRIVRDKDESEWAEIEESGIKGKETIYRHGDEWGEIDDYTGREIVYDKHGREWGEVKLEYKDDMTFADVVEPIVGPAIERFIGLFNPDRLFKAVERASKQVTHIGSWLMLFAGGCGLFGWGLLTVGDIQRAAPKVEDFWFVWNWQNAMSAYLVGRMAEVLGSFAAMFIGVILLIVSLMAATRSPSPKKV
jgi:hypothetical protein